jgi:hypothetical protein
MKIKGNFLRLLFACSMMFCTVAHARYFDAVSGRFMSIDPVMTNANTGGSFNRYYYANNNPYRYVDPDGRQFCGAYQCTVIGDNADNGSARMAHPIESARPYFAGAWQAVEKLGDWWFMGLTMIPTEGVGSVAAKGLIGLAKETEFLTISGQIAKDGVSGSRALTTYYPAADGFLGTANKISMPTGQIIDRFGGSEFSRFFSPLGTPAAARALPPRVAEQTLRTFEVLKPFEAHAGTVAPAFGQFGLGTQYRTSMTLGELLEGKFLKEIAP